MTSERNRRGKRICFVIEKLADRSGGAERVLIDLANELAERGHQIDILSHEHRGKPPFYALAPGVVHTNIRPRGRNRSLARRGLDRAREGVHKARVYAPPMDRAMWLSQHGGFWRRLGAHLAALRPDVAVAFLPPAMTALALARPGYELRRVGSIHNVPSQDFASPERYDPNPRDVAIRRGVLPRFDALSVLLPEYRDWFAPEHRGRVYVVPNAVYPVKPAAIAQARRRRVVLAVGRLAQVKRPELMLRAWARIVPDFPDWSLKMFGLGPMEAELKTLATELGIAESVRLGQHTKDIRREYLAAALLAHPAKHEGFPLAVTEALAHGLPVVGFDDCTGLNALVEDGRNGVLVASDGDRLEAFAAALAALMSAPDRRAALSGAAPQSVARYTPKAVFDRWEEVILGEAEAPLTAPR